MSKLITVFGATGNQGGSVINHILDNPELSKTWKIRAITRDVSKPSATKLKERGAEVVTANMNDKASLEKAVQGSNAVFGVTNFWEGMDGEAETRQGKNLVDASKAAGVERFIFSSLPNVSKESHGKLTSVKHFDSKAHVEEYAREQGLAGSYVMPGPFMSFVLQSFQKQDDGSYSWAVPFAPDTTQLPLLDAAGDTGLFVAAILLNLDETLNKRVLAATGYQSPNELAAEFSTATGKKGEVKQIPWEVFGSFFSENTKEELVGNFKLMENPGYYVGEPKDAVDWSVGLVAKAGLRKPITFQDYVKKNFKA